MRSYKRLFFKLIKFIFIVLKKSEPQAPETAFDSLDEKSIQKIYPSTVSLTLNKLNYLFYYLQN